MKKFFITLLLLIAFFSSINAQNNEKKYSVSFGYGQLYNLLEDDYYYHYKFEGYTTIETLNNYSFKISFPSKNKNIDFLLGASYSKDNISFSGFGWSPGIYGPGYESLTGASIYGGIKPSIKFKYFSIVSEFSGGYFLFSQSYAKYDKLQNIDVNYKKSSIFGSQLSLGFDVKYWHLGISPRANLTLSFGTDVFLFYGFEIPLVIHF